MRFNKAPSRKVLLACSVFAASIAVYCGSLRGRFISDDIPLIVENGFVRGPLALSEIFASTYWQRTESRALEHAHLYRPLTTLSYHLNRRLFGMNPLGFHGVNVLLHALSAVLVFILMGYFGFSLGAAALGSLAFAVLPVHVEAVGWISGRTELLAALFVLAGWILLLPDPLNWTRTAAGLACYACALLSKESAAPFPAVLILGDLFRRQGSVRQCVDRRLVVWASAFGVLGLYLLWRRAIFGTAFSMDAPYFSSQSALVIFLTMASFFFEGWLLPIVSGMGLCADYSRPTVPDAEPGSLLAWLALAMLAVLLGWTVREFWKKKSPWAFSSAIFFLLAAPFSNLLVPMGIIGAERIMYLPSVGFCLLLGVIWDSGLSAKFKRTPSPKALALVGLLAWTLLTVARNRTWRTSADYYAAAVNCAPDNPRALSGLGVAMESAGRHEEARALFRKALRINPSFSEAVYNLAKSYFDGGDLNSAKIGFSDLEKRSVLGKDSLCYLGLIAEREGRSADALSYYDRALQVDPSGLEPLRNVGLLLCRIGKVRGGIAYLERYLRGNPPAEDAIEISQFLRRIKDPGSVEPPHNGMR